MHYTASELYVIRIEMLAGLRRFSCPHSVLVQEAGASYHRYGALFETSPRVSSTSFPVPTDNRHSLRKGQFLCIGIVFRLNHMIILGIHSIHIFRFSKGHKRLSS